MTTHDETTPYYTPAEVARIMSVHVVTVRRWIADGEMPAIRVGKRHLRIPRSYVDALQTDAEAHRPDYSMGLGAPIPSLFAGEDEQR